MVSCPSHEVSKKSVCGCVCARKERRATQVKRARWAKIGVGAQDEAKREGRVRDGEGKEGFHDSGEQTEKWSGEEFTTNGAGRHHHPTVRIAAGLCAVLRSEAAERRALQSLAVLGAEIGVPSKGNSIILLSQE
jgi:hypothetical protein